MIKQKSIDEVLETARVEDVVEDFVSLKRRGVNMIGLCPFHNEKTPSFTVSPSKGIYKCFGCGAGGDALKFVMEHEHLNFPEGIRYLAKKYGIELEEKQLSQEAREERQYEESLYLVNQFAKDFYQKQLFETDRGKSVGLSYFKRRGFREEIIRKFGLGYAPAGKDTFTLTAVQTGYDAELLKKLGLTSQYGRDFFRDRVMFAIHSLSGKVIGFRRADTGQGRQGAQVCQHAGNGCLQQAQGLVRCLFCQAGYPQAGRVHYGGRLYGCHFSASSRH